MRRMPLLLMSLLIMPLIVSGCAWKKSTTVSQSDATILETSDANLLPQKIQGTQQISLAANNVYVQDDGVREVFVRNTDSTSLAKEIVTRLTRPTEDMTSLTSMQLKQASISL